MSVVEIWQVWPKFHKLYPEGKEELIGTENSRRSAEIFIRNTDMPAHRLAGITFEIREPRKGTLLEASLIDRKEPVNPLDKDPKKELRNARQRRWYNKRQNAQKEYEWLHRFDEKYIKAQKELEKEKQDREKLKAKKALAFKPYNQFSLIETDYIIDALRFSRKEAEKFYKFCGFDTIQALDESNKLLEKLRENIAIMKEQMELENPNEFGNPEETNTNFQNNGKLEINDEAQTTAIMKALAQNKADAEAKTDSPNSPYSND